MNTDHYILLIYKKLKGTILPEEAAALQKWEAASPENQAIAEETRQVWSKTEEYELPFELDYDADFAQVKSTIATSSPAAKVVPMQPRRRWLQVAAAAAIILLGSTFLFKNYFTSSQELVWKNIAASSEIQELQLADGSKVWLNAGSTLSFPTKFSTTDRPVKLNGEAFFEVSKDAQRPFQITTNRTTVTVLGTAFGVRDYAHETTTEVAVREGKVRVEKNNSTQKVILVANEKAIYNDQNKQLKKVADKNLNSLAWQRKNLKFEDTSLKNVFATIARQYDVKILMNKNIEKCTVSGFYKTETKVFDLLKSIASVHHLQVKKLKNKVFELQGKGCNF
ncbi:MAG TPA: DUF4974 domain-containing protein [Phaeodactylibacter sp.]|nr:DUF4974 domain-containing protein [Phaeodactylibacter sp.]